MTLQIPASLLREIENYAESRYPEEAAGLILGAVLSETRVAQSVLPLENQFEGEQRGRRYRIEPEEMLRAERRAEELEQEIIGVFHSHPDHPPIPSQFDLEWAVPWYFYLITSLRGGVAEASRAWRLEEDHSQMNEAQLHVIQEAS